jgi:sec-independent protein translocase protein TatB
MGKARKMAAEFQGQFQEAMREAEMADLKKSFDEVKQAATDFTGGNLVTSLEKDVNSALKIEDIDKPALPETDTPAISHVETPAIDAAAASAAAMPAAEAPIPRLFTEADAQALASEPLAITREVERQPEPHDTAVAAPDGPRDAKAS